MLYQLRAVILEFSSVAVVVLGSLVANILRSQIDSLLTLPPLTPATPTIKAITLLLYSRLHVNP